MQSYKCRKCGAELVPQEDQITAVCEYCGNVLRLPRVDKNLYNRANELRMEKKFDQSAAMFRECISQDPQDAEAHWNLLLCKFGIEYVKDSDGSYLPTCNGIMYDPIMEDEDYLDAVRFADELSARMYKDEAEKIQVVQQEIIKLAQKAEDFDVFISYKETDENGARTEESVLAQTIYEKLTEKGYKVFFSRVTLKGQAGLKYEPIIFSALNSASVMLLVGTSNANMESVWVKNEWTRFINLMEADKDKKIEVVYKGMDRIDLPANLRFVPQRKISEDDKFGWYQDIVYDVDSMLEFKKKAEVQTEFVRETDEEANERSIQNCYIRAEQLLEEHRKEDALETLEQALDVDYERAETWWRLLWAASDQMAESDGKTIEPSEQIRRYAQGVLKYAKESEIEWNDAAANYLTEWTYAYGSAHYIHMAEGILSDSCYSENTQELIEREYKLVEQYAPSDTKAKAKKEKEEWEANIPLWKEYQEKTVNPRDLYNHMADTDDEYGKAVKQLSKHCERLKKSLRIPTVFSIVNVLFLVYLAIAPFIMSRYEIEDATEFSIFTSLGFSACWGSMLFLGIYLIMILISAIIALFKKNEDTEQGMITVGCVMGITVSVSIIATFFGGLGASSYASLGERYGLYIYEAQNYGRQEQALENESYNAIVQAYQPVFADFLKILIVIIIVHIVLAVITYIHLQKIKKMKEKKVQLIEKVKNMTGKAVERFEAPYVSKLGKGNMRTASIIYDISKSIAYYHKL